MVKHWLKKVNNMCIICIEYQKQKLTVKEAIRNLNEMKSQIEEQHYLKTLNMLNEELEETQLEEWWEEFGFGD
tara:strand:+ start:1387 stop:1605 length:219 start_codon:yes stop_codon:yes gene_type:complete